MQFARDCQVSPYPPKRRHGGTCGVLVVPLVSLQNVQARSSPWGSPVTIVVQRHLCKHHTVISLTASTAVVRWPLPGPNARPLFLASGCNVIPGVAGHISEVDILLHCCTALSHRGSNTGEPKCSLVRPGIWCLGPYALLRTYLEVPRCTTVHAW